MMHIAIAEIHSFIPERDIYARRNLLIPFGQSERSYNFVSF